MNRYLSCLRLNAVLFCKIFTCGFLGQKDYAEGYDNVAENYDDNWLCHIKPCTQNFLDRLPPLQSDKPIVDLGCGTGFSTEWLTKRYDNPVTGVDISAGMLKQAAKKMPQTQFVHADMLDYLRKLPAESRAMSARHGQSAIPIRNGLPKKPAASWKRKAFSPSSSIRQILCPESLMLSGVPCTIIRKR